VDETPQPPDMTADSHEATPASPHAAGAGSTDAPPGPAGAAPAAPVVEVMFRPLGFADALSLGTMDPAAAMSLLDLLRDADVVVVPAEEGTGTTEVPSPNGYVVEVDGERPGRITVRTSFHSGRHHSRDDEDLGVPGGDPHSGPASLVVVLDHWAEEHGLRLVHTPEQLNQPVEQFIAGLSPDERQRVVIVNDDDDSIIRIGEVPPGNMEVLEIAAMSADWLASLPRFPG
jgi:hypothetical protein